jgi:hypothetical protein
MFHKLINAPVRNLMVRGCHHSKRLEDYQLIGLKNKLLDIEIHLSNISRDLNSINNLVGTSPLENTNLSDKYICKMCLVDQLISTHFFENNKVIKDSQKNICTICRNTRK